MKKALVIGGAGFVGHNLAKRLVKGGWVVDVMDIKPRPDFEESPANTYIQADASTEAINLTPYLRVYQLAADMGGAGFVFTGDNDADILTNSLSINLNVLKHARWQDYKGKIFYSSSVCGYPDEVEGKESDAYPANPPSNYGWEKLTSERLYLAYAKNYGVNSRLARFHNCFGPHGTYEGGREKSPAAICRKVIQANKEIEIWGNGEQLRPFIYIEDLLDGIEALMTSDYRNPVNLGPSDGITINQMVDIVCGIAKKELKKVYVDGPTGGQVRNANNDLAKKVLNWQPTRDLKSSLSETYHWIEKQLNG